MSPILKWLRDFFANEPPLTDDEREVEIRKDLANGRNDLFCAADCRMLIRKLDEARRERDNVEAQTADWQRFANEQAQEAEIALLEAERLRHGIGELRTRILEVVRACECQTRDIVNAIPDRPEKEVRDAVWTLVEMGQLQLTSDWKLRVC